MELRCSNLCNFCTRLQDGEARYTGAMAVREIVIVDRWLDPVTPLLSQLTYHGLIDELFTLVAGDLSVLLAVDELLGLQEL